MKKAVDAHQRGGFSVAIIWTGGCDSDGLLLAVKYPARLASDRVDKKEGFFVEIRQVPINMLNPATYNPRKDLQPGDTQYEKLKKSIEEFGYVDPIIWNERSGNVIGGHQRLKILVDQGADAVDVSVVNLGPVQEKALNLALNKISGVWDMEKLGTVFQDIQSELTDLSVTGFSSIEITELYQGNSIDIDTLFSPAPTADQKPKPPEQVQCPRCHEWFEVAG